MTNRVITDAIRFRYLKYFCRRIDSPKMSGKATWGISFSAIGFTMDGVIDEKINALDDNQFKILERD